ILEITVTIALLVVTSTMIEGYWRTVHGKMGFATAPLITARVDNPNGVPSRQILEKLRQTPGIARAAASTSVPTRVAGPRVPVAAAAAAGESLIAERGDITEDFFTTLGVSLRTGRMFTPADTAASRVAIVSEALARLLYESRSPVGSRIWIAAVPYDVIGVVADYASNPLLADKSEPRVFIPFAADSHDTKRMSFLIRSAGDPSGLVQTIRNEIRVVGAGTVSASAEHGDQWIGGGREEMVGGAATT